MEKLVIIINGKGEVGKDTLCNIASKNYKALTISSITPIKKIAIENGWNEKKDEKARKLLSELKRIFEEYNNLPNKYLIEEYNKFLKDGNNILFVHIREKEQIEIFKNAVSKKCITLLIRRESRVFGNNSDDEVENYNYDYYYDNVYSLIKTEELFISFLKNILKKENVNI